MLRKEKKFLRSFNKILAVQFTVEIKLHNTFGFGFSRTSVLITDFLSKVEFQTNLNHNSFTNKCLQNLRQGHLLTKAIFQNALVQALENTLKF